MGIELVTGKAADLHVSSEDDRLLHCRIYGDGAYVLNGCTVTMTSSNNCHISQGELMVQGGFVRIDQDGVDVAISNGTQGQMRNTIIALQYNKDGDDIESMKFVAINGSNATSAPSDPTVTTNDINAGASTSQWKFARIQLNGLSVGTPEVLFEKGETLSGFRDSISQNSKRSEWGSSYVQYQKRGGIVVCSGQVETTIPQWQKREISTIPDEFMPSLDKTDGVFINISGLGTMTAYGNNGAHPGKLYAMAINAVTNNAIVFNLSWISAK